MQDAEISDVAGERTLIERTVDLTEDQQKTVVTAIGEKYGVTKKISRLRRSQLR